MTTATSPIPQSSSEEITELRTLVRIAFVLRLVMLLAALVGVVGQELTPVALFAIVFLAVTSMVALSWPGAVDVLHRHPLLVIGDILVSTGLLLVLGVDNPLVLATLSTSLIVGVLMSPLAAALSTVVLVGGYVVAAVDQPELTFVTVLALPLMFISVTVIGQAFRIVGQRKRESERAFADVVSGAAAAEERSRLARELHDSTAKTLQGLALGARSLDVWIEREPARAREHARDIAESAESAIAELRGLLTSLRQDRPELPLDRTMQSLARDLSQLHRIRVRCALEPVEVHDAAVRYEVLAATREAVINAATHSGVTTVDLRLHRTDTEVVVEVEDKGSGFDPGILVQREIEGHFGVRGYTERMAVVGGHAQLHTGSGGGTRVVLVAPVAGLRERAPHSATEVEWTS